MSNGTVTGLIRSGQRHSVRAKRWREHRDRDAAFKLVTSHLRLVAKIAMRYRGYGLPIADMVSEGNIGLMQAVKRFDPDRGVRLERDVVDMNRRMQGDVSLNAPVHHDEDKAGDVLDWLVDPAPTQETTFAEQQEAAYRRQALKSAIATLNPANVESSPRAD